MKVVTKERTPTQPTANLVIFYCHFILCFVDFSPVCVGSNTWRKYFNNSDPDQGAIAKIEHEEEQHGVEDGQPVYGQ